MTNIPHANHYRRRGEPNRPTANRARFRNQDLRERAPAAEVHSRAKGWIAFLGMVALILVIWLILARYPWIAMLGTVVAVGYFASRS